MKHRTAIVTASSIVGVLLAGATAAAANLGILSVSASDAALGTADPTVAAAPALTTTEPPLVLETEPAPATPQPELLAYEIPQVGVVTVERAGDSLSVNQIDAPGWQWTVGTDGSNLAVNLTDGTRLIEFTASVVNGEVTVGVAEQSPPGQGSDDGDERYESDDHEDEGHDDD
jgi:hypothetical protein